MSKENENRIAFAVSFQGEGDGIPLVIMGVPKAAWEHMKDGNTHHFDLTTVGIACKLILFGSETHETAQETMRQAAKDKGVRYVDATGQYFGIKSLKDTDKKH